jgi:DNA-binding transcriptional LysR family regulator
METTAAIRLPPLLASFHREMPAVELNLKTSPTELLMQQVSNNELDVVLLPTTKSCMMKILHYNHRSYARRRWCW